MDQASTESTTCTGLPSDVYDRYVLGLLDREDREHVDRHIEQQCPSCILGVQRSMNLWLVFANSLEHVEPAADFRARLVRIAELSNRVLTVPKRLRRVREPAILIWSLVVVGLVLVTLLVFSWFAGRQSVRLDAQRERAKLGPLESEAAEYYVKLQQQLEKDKLLEAKLKSPGQSAADQQKLEDQLRKAQAAAQQYLEIIARDQQRTTDNSTLVNALSNPGVKLLTLKSPEGGSSTAYAFVIENSKVIFVSSNLPPAPDQDQYQLWLVRKDAPLFVSAGVFSSGEDKSVVITYDQDREVISGLTGLIVTVEPINGSSAPTGVRVLETPGVATTVTMPSAAAN